MIDVHAHFFPDSLFRAIWKWFEKYGWHVRYQVMADEVVSLLKEQGIERFAVLNYAHKPGMSESLNSWTYEFCKKHPEAIPFGTVHPDDENVGKILDRCFQDHHFFGIKLHCHVMAIRPDDERMFPIYEKVVEYDRVITLHAGKGPGLPGYQEKTELISGARFVRPILKKFPKLKLIVPHLGADEFDAFFDLMEEFPNLRMDTTMALAGHFPFEIPWEKIEQFSDRILYGSDFPNIPYERDMEIKNISSSVLSPEAKQRILGENARTLLSLP